MPELPEVETIARTLAPQVLRRVLGNPRCFGGKTPQAGREFLPLLEGAEVAGVRRRAKLLLLDLIDASNRPLIMAFHLKMTGHLFVHPLEAVPPKHTKLILDLYPDSRTSAPEARLLFDDARTFGYCRILRPESLEEWPFWAALGLEPLEHGPEELAAALAGKKRQIKNLLLDQSLIAGIGNIYADESLFRAGIRPDRQGAGIPGERLFALAGHVQEILREAIAACGSSIRDYLDAQGNSGAFQDNFKVYGRGGKPCQICGGILQSCRVAGRGTVYCPRCQK
ncbi:MAG: bifunctional DNA-formamidopyrimidine glycosylase/DNA-(apurinic or apyrimidinic site) lyase [Desulfovibrionaceae bacterium]|nr:bifunctional DNA-formamidopyrimidine glycosylase/DNA-(apurinic or apyrimidinic site) lyase [Desulfovibrionaceae bacterium]